MAQEEVQAGSETQASTPDAGAAASPETVVSQHQINPTAGDATSAQRQAVDPDAMALQLLDEKKSPSEVRKMVFESATPAASESGPGEDGPAKVESEGDQKPPQTAQADYDGLDDRSKQQLSQTGLLPKNPAHWNALPEEVRQAQLEHARTILSEKSRLWQAQQALSRPRNERGQFVAGQAPDDKTAAGEAQADDLAQPQEAQGKGKAGAKSQRSFKDILAGLSDTFGEEAVQPLVEAFELSQAQRTEQEAARDEELAEMKAMHNFNVEQTIASDEQKATAIISQDLPEYATNAEMQAAVREEAKIRLQAAYIAHVDTTWEQCLVYGARAILYPNIRQSEQAKLATARQQTLRATPDRGNQQSSPARALSPEDKDRMAMKLLEQGKSPAEVRMALSA